MTNRFNSIAVSNEIKERLKELKLRPDETWENLFRRIIKNLEEKK